MSQSTIEKQQLANVSVDPTAGGAAGEDDGIFESEPMCLVMTAWASLQASKNGSQWPYLSWIDGSSRFGGISLKHTACTPRAALRRTSLAASTGSHNGIRHSGIRRPPDSPHHSSTIQSL